MAIDVEEIKEYLQDKPGLNILLDNIEQFDEDLIELTEKMVYDSIKAISPALRGRESKIPKVTIMEGIIARLLESEAFVQLRNKITTSDNNMASSSIYGKEGSYLQMAQMFKQSFRESVMNFAKASFYESCWGERTSNSSDIEHYDSMMGFGVGGYNW